MTELNDLNSNLSSLGVSNTQSIDFNSNLDPYSNIPCYKNLSTTQYVISNISSCSSNNYLSTFHCNIRSLNANFDHFSHLLHQLSHSFSVIGLSETKLKLGHVQITNFNLSGYNFISQPSISKFGDVGFYVNSSLMFSVRHDLSITTRDFDSLNPKQFEQ